MLLQWEASFGWSRSQITAAMTLALLLSAITSPRVGLLIDRGAGPYVMTACTALGGICLLVLTVCQSLMQFYLLWMLIGVALGGCLYEPCFALITRARGASAKRGITAITLIAGFASSISFPLTHYLSGKYGWQWAIVVMAATVLTLGCPLMWLGARAIERQAQARSVSEILSTPQVKREYLKHKGFWFLAVSFALLAILHGVTLHHLLAILATYGVSKSTAVAVASLIGPMQVSGRLLILLIGSRVSNHIQSVASFVILGASIALLALTQFNSTLAFMFVALFGGAYGTVSILRPVRARDILGESNFGAKSGVLAMIYLLGVAIAPFLGSLLWSIGGYDFVLGIALLFAVAGLSFYQISVRTSTTRSINPVR